MSWDIRHTSFILFWLVVLFNYTDYKTTTWILEKGGMELNPILNYFIGFHGNQAILWFKGIFLAVLFKLMVWNHLKDPKWRGWKPLAVILFIMSWVYMGQSIYNYSYYLISYT